MARVDERTERLGKAKYLSTLDLCKGYWQIPMTESAKELNAFRVPSGLYHWGEGGKGVCEETVDYAAGAFASANLLCYG